MTSQTETQSETQAIVERLCQPYDCEETMVKWDAWRKYIAEGGEGSWPRDAFESILSCADEERQDAAALISRQQEEIGASNISAGERADDVHRISEAFYDLHAAALEAVICAEANCLTKDAPATARLRAALQAKPPCYCKGICEAEANGRVCPNAAKP